MCIVYLTQYTPEVVLIVYLMQYALLQGEPNCFSDPHEKGKKKLNVKFQDKL
jgi:hypothetical protein